MKWDAATAILSGDTMLTMAGMMVTKGLRDKSALDILALFNDTAIDVYEGQQKDMDFESRTDVTIEEYLDMISQKTGALIAAPCLMGAILANADEDRRQAFKEFGKALGKDVYKRQILHWGVFCCQSPDPCQWHASPLLHLFRQDGTGNHRNVQEHLPTLLLQ